VSTTKRQCRGGGCDPIEFCIAGPLTGWLSDRFGAHAFAIGGVLLVATTFVALRLIPVDFPYWLFGLIPGGHTAEEVCDGLVEAVDCDADTSQRALTCRPAASGSSSASPSNSLPARAKRSAGKPSRAFTGPANLRLDRAKSYFDR